MKKSFPLALPELKPARVVEAIKRDVKRYVKRERRKELPEGVDFCDFDCRLGKDSDSAGSVHVAELNQGIDLAAAEGWPAVYIEILARPGYRTRKPRGESALEDPSASE
jgi:hypothetical protein